MTRHRHAARYAVLLGAREEIRNLPLLQRLAVAFWVYWDDVPWGTGRLFGAWVFGVGALLVAEPHEVFRFGWGFLRHIYGPCSVALLAIGAFQVFVETKRIVRLRSWAAFPALAVYSAVMLLTDSPTGHLAYGVGFTAEALIILKRV